MNFLFLLLSSSFFSLIQSQPIKDDHLKIRNPIHLEKRITSIFPNSGHSSITFTTVHLIAAVIGIIGGIVLITVIVYIFVKRRRLKQKQQQLNNNKNYYSSIMIYKKSSTLSSSESSESSSKSIKSSSDNNNHNNNGSTTVLIIPSKIQSPSMSQFETFQSAYYYDEIIKEKSIRQSYIKDDNKSNLTFPPPPYNP